MTTESKESAYEQAINEGHDHAWGGRWLLAAKAYRRALAERPDDVAAHTSLGLALLEAGRTQEALEVYLRIEALHPGSTATLAKIAEIYAALGNHEAAAGTLLLLADRFITNRQPGQAVRTWQQVLRHDRSNKVALRKLAEAYRRGKRPDFAAQALVALARVHQQEGRPGQAIACCEQALALRPGYSAAWSLLAQLQREGQPRPAAGEAPAGRSAPGPPAPGSPTEQAAQLALSRMAEAFFEAGDSADVQVEALKARALDYQTRGLIEEAARTYREICKLGVEPPEVLYNLGVLSKEMLRFDEAIKILERVRHHPDYALAANFAIGQCYQRKGRMDEALDHFLEAIKILDLQSVGREQADDLIKLYEGLADSYEAKGDRGQAEHFTAALADFLTSRGWEDKLRELRHRVAGFDGGETITLAELLEVPESETVLASMAASQQYLEQGLVTTAVEEVYWALGLAPHHLPLHLRLADLLAHQGRADEAVAKLVAVAEVYTIRGNLTQAIRTLERALDISPLDQTVRSRLIDLLVSHGEIDPALEHYLALAEGFYQLALVDRAIEKLNEALRLAPRGTPERNWSLIIQRRLADIHLQRLDWRRAAAALEAVNALAPDELDVGQQLVDLYYKLGHNSRARNILETISEQWTARGESGAVLALWRGPVDQHPEDLDLRRRFGEHCAQAGRVEEACAAWEPLVDDYLQTGETAQAAALLRRMIGLKSDNEAQYRARLQELVRAGR